MDNTYIKLFRRITEWEWYGDTNTTRVFLHILLKANYEPSEYRGVKIGRGECVFGRKTWAEELGLTERQIRTALDRLKTTNEVTTKSTNKFTVITVEKWDFWQVEEGLNDQQNDQQKVKQTTTSKEYKNTTTTIKEPNVPKYDDVLNYIKEKNLLIDADVFYTYFEGRNWYDKLNKPVLNWKLKCLQWNNDEKKRRENDKGKNRATARRTAETYKGTEREVSTETRSDVGGLEGIFNL